MKSKDVLKINDYQKKSKEEEGKMIKIQLRFLFGERVGDKETWYCNDEKTGKFYFRTLVHEEDGAIETIEEIPEGQLVEYINQNQQNILNSMEAEL